MTRCLGVLCLVCGCWFRRVYGYLRSGVVCVNSVGLILLLLFVWRYGLRWYGYWFGLRWLLLFSWVDAL